MSMDRDLPAGRRLAAGRPAFLAAAICRFCVRRHCLVSMSRDPPAGICQEVNAMYDVESLCKEFPSRLQDLVDAEGDHIGK